MVIKDLPDYSIEIIHKYDGGFIGLEELAARLGSVLPGSQPGNLVFMDDFESELTEWYDAGDPGNLAARTTTHKSSGDWSVILPAELSEGINYANPYRYFHYPGLKKYALFLKLGWDTDLQTFGVQATFYTGTREIIVQLYYDYLSGALYVMTTGGAYYTVATGLYLGQSIVVFYPILIEFDLENEVYGHLYFAGNEYDLSAIPLCASADTTAPSASMSVLPYPDETGSFNIYLGCVALTKDIS